MQKTVTKKDMDRATRLYADLNNNHYELIVLANKISMNTGQGKIDDDSPKRLYEFIKANYDIQSKY